MRTISFTHVRRTSNKVVDLLDNEGVYWTKSNNIYEWIEIPQGRLRENYLRQMNADRELYQSREKEKYVDVRCQGKFDLL